MYIYVYIYICMCMCIYIYIWLKPFSVSSWLNPCAGVRACERVFFAYLHLSARQVPLNCALTKDSAKLAALSS